MRKLLLIFVCSVIMNNAFAQSAPDSPYRNAGNLIFISGQGAGSVNDPAHIDKQITDAFKQLSAVAKSAGASMQDVVNLTVHLTDANDYAILNSVSHEFFFAPLLPARSTVIVAGLPKQHRIEIAATLLKPIH